MTAADTGDWNLLGAERVRVEELEEAGREGFALLYQVGRRILAADSFDDVIQLALSLVFECVDAKRGALLLRDPHTGQFVPRVVRDHRRGPLAPEELPVPRSIVSEVVNERVGLLITDADRDMRFSSKASVRQSKIRSAMCAPLWDQEQVLGVIYLDSLEQSYAFTRADLLLLNAIANLVALRLKQEMLNEQLSSERIVRSNLARYHSPGIVDSILARSREQGSRPDLGLEERDVSLLFADLRGFTPFAEGSPPSVVAGVLNEYYELGTKVIFDHGGTIIDFVGDSVLAAFGAPVFQPNHADRAVAAGLALLRRIHEIAPVEDFRYQPELRVSINTGRVVVGNIGSLDQLKYAAVGDAVNVASRMQGLVEPNTVLIGESTWKCLASEFSYTDLGPQQLRGREVPVRMFRVTSDSP